MKKNQGLKKNSEHPHNKEQRLSSIINAITESALLIDRNGTILTINSKAASMLGSTPKKLKEKNIFDTLPKEEVGERKKQHRQILRTKKPVIIETERGDRLVLLSIYPVLSDKGSITGFAVFSHDMTEHRRDQKRFEALTKSASDLFQVVNSEGIMTYLSPSVKRILGYRPEELIGKPSISVVHPDDVPAVANGFEEAFRNPGKSVYTVCRCRHKDGRWRVLAGWGTNHLANPAIRGFVANTRDITDQCETEQRLRESEEKFRNIIEQSIDGITLIDDSGTIIEYNSGQEKISGIKRSEAIGKKIWDIQYRLMNKKNRKRKTYNALKALHQKMLKTGDSDWLKKVFEVEINRNDGSNLILQSIIFPITLREKTIYGSINRDVTELREKEMEIEEQNTLLKDKNTALREVMEQLESEKRRIGDKVLANVKRFILPLISHMRMKSGEENIKKYIDLLEDNLRDITSTFGDTISQKMLRLTQKEVEICNMIRKGLTCKEIARLMDISHRTVEIHRNRIRKKLQIEDPAINLATYLEALDRQQ